MRKYLVTTYVLGCVGFIALVGTARIPIGRMLLPASQAAMLAATVVVIFSSALFVGLVWLRWLQAHLQRRWRTGFSGHTDAGISERTDAGFPERTDAGTQALDGANLLDRPGIRLCSLLIPLAALALWEYGTRIEPRWLQLNHFDLQYDGAVLHIRPGVARSTDVGLSENTDAGFVGHTDVGSPGSHGGASSASRTASDRASLRIAVISDLHVEERRPPITALAARINATSPHVIVLLGDLLGSTGGLDALHEALADMHAPLGKFAIYGNWERWYWGHLPLLRGTGFRWLDGTTTIRRQGATVHLVGLPYQDRHPIERANQLLANLGPGLTIFCYHTPDLAPAVHNAHLYLAGHTHGGQIALPGYGALVTLSEYGKTYERGLVRTGKMWVYTNAGIGVEPVIPLRLGVRPEITVLDVQEANRK